MELMNITRQEVEVVLLHMVQYDVSRGYNRVGPGEDSMPDQGRGSAVSRWSDRTKMSYTADAFLLLISNMCMSNKSQQTQS